MKIELWRNVLGICDKNMYDIKVIRALCLKRRTCIKNVENPIWGSILL